MKKRINRLSAGFLALAFCNAVAAAVFIFPSKASACELQNDYLTVCVQDNSEKPAYGSFTLQKAGDSKKDTLTYSQFYSSYTTININGSTYRYGDGKVVKKPYSTGDGHIVAVQDFDGVEVTQSLSLTTGNSSKEDMLLAEYSSKNNTGSDVLISMRIIIDPTLSGSEADLIQAGGKEFKTETVKNGIDVPDNWCIKDAENNITAYGILNSGDNKPDIFQAANWKNLYNTENDYMVDGTDITDNAVAMTWSGTTVLDGNTIKCETKYGLYSEKSGNSSSADETSSIAEGSDNDRSAADSIQQSSSLNNSTDVSENSDSKSDASDVSSAQNNSSDISSVKSQTSVNSSSQNNTSENDSNSKASESKTQNNSDDSSPNTGIKLGLLFGAGSLISLVAAALCSLRKKELK